MATRTSFFKILIFDFHTRLRIPPAFIKNLEKNVLEKLPQQSILETDDGRFWHVDVEKIDNNLCFKKGWKKFVQQNSLKMGDLIVFSYHGNFRFKLEIYGRNCCRRRVETLRKHGRKTIAGKSMPVYQPRPIRTVRRKNHGKLNYVQRRGGGRSKCSSGKVGEVVYIEISDSDDETDDGERLFGQRENPKKTSGLETAQNYSSGYPSFKVTMTSSYLHNSYVNVPKRLMRANGLKRVTTNIKLVVSDRTWLMKMFNRPKYTRFCSGWTDFVKDNRLQEQDVCLFELIDSNDVSFRVTIFRNIA
ncbi:REPRODUCTIVE MERISTEM 39, REDUCED VERNALIZATION RESPONSE 1 [Hibiscus trionum]|uniref:REPRODUCTIVE MERISTEM 39, REDUCED VERNALIZATION RESPONSE 1 n=1 Tax=Hibiscus trionum TaxID=183268 RepID=A0A9W7HX30_HIBTR|nr:REPRODUCTIVE MERISTEM 39, REDUCED VERNALIZATION RESPONSE 1 [Hibiscus trionum]